MIRLLLILSVLFMEFTAAGEAGERQQKVYHCAYRPDLPQSPEGWSRFDDGSFGTPFEARFSEYDSESAKALANDALEGRGGEQFVTAGERQTSFLQAYDDRGWYVYIRLAEPEAQAIKDGMVNPRSAGHQESIEFFFTPGLERVPYYQIFIRPYKSEATFYDWGSPHAFYRTLKHDTKVSSLVREKEASVLVFVPWHLLYDSLPFAKEGGEPWRFSIIRWMPHGKAGGVTWGGRVHETGRFGMVEFTPPTGEQRLAIERRLLRYGCDKFQSDAETLSARWSDPETGDVTFFESHLKPHIDEVSAFIASLGASDSWSDAEIGRGVQQLRALYELDTTASSQRVAYLTRKRLDTEGAISSTSQPTK